MKSPSSRISSYASVSALLIVFAAPSLGLFAGYLDQLKHSRTLLPHLLLPARLVPLFLLLRVTQNAQRARHLPRLHRRQGLAQVLCELFREDGVERIGLVPRDDGGHDLFREGGEAVLGIGSGGEDGLEGLGA